MKLFGYLVLATFCLATTSAFSNPILYIDDANGNLGTVDVATGAATVIGQTGVSLTDIAFSPSGKLYGISFTDLYEINLRTAEAKDIGPHGIPEGNALVFGSDGTLYGAGYATTELYFIDVTTGAAQVITDLGFASAGDLAFNGGELYLSSTTAQLIQIDPATFAAVDVGAFGFDNVYGLATGDNGVLYGVSGTEVFSVDTATGAGTFLVDYGGQGLAAADGTSFVSEAVPIITSALTGNAQVALSYSYQITSTNQPFYYQASGLPSGLSINSTTGVISGTPTQAGTFDIELFAVDEGGGGGTATLVLTVAPEKLPGITSALSPTTKVGAAFSYQITATNLPTGFAAGALPPGLFFYPEMGIISGVPAQAGTFAIPFSVSNGAGTSTGTLTLVVAAGPPTLPVVTLSATIPRVTAGSGRFGEFTITRLGNQHPSALHIRYKARGSAVKGQDYAPLKGVITMKAGQTSVKIRVIPREDGVGPGETRDVVLVVRSGFGYIVETPSSNDITIVGQ